MLKIGKSKKNKNKVKSKCEKKAKEKQIIINDKNILVDAYKIIYQISKK